MFSTSLSNSDTKATKVYITRADIEKKFNTTKGAH